ncbi:hypothetical protein SEA_ZION_7 [Corynebacterium phage Zion]|uniref:Uncharacterized protein n=8 Tax=Ceetrepovirus TaxID=2560111 RepID=A0A2H4P8N8_9CAUD|nr:hypothetical protein FDJ10_gp07 [Corynebacterium phage C3PO]YP_009620258.1 hypothetical protein FDJ11_gp07 [Corynebacterium phage Darwin]YP_009620352.1 hypothetical protein FDJ12_gp07 [Corynebacterium phage Zion]ATW58697.1 hypothetical protein SEA_POTATOCHIP_7 [Corynebacterium phage PotatoChip]ATW58510.1 hypothetical protein SEA_C3PO_7 [Corynebacterium phage C3PO]ATW58593.1 hypothetical protein SEA_DARWIN_7 [Corynebacterium phage Darwin]ATW58850.1 hypothetical protein SEA_ZION_7 [Corynebac
MKRSRTKEGFMYKIFDISLPDSYIRELTGIEISLLIDEARAEHRRLEKEINEVVQPTFPIADLDDPTAPLPSEYSYDPMLYRDEIAEDPALEKKLEVAKELSERVGLVLAVLGSAQTQRARLINLEARIDRERSRS